jgi:hypothetical protein
MRRGDEGNGGEKRVTVSVGAIERIGVVSGITCTMTKIVINSTQVYPGAGQITVEPGKIMTIKFSFTASAPGAGLVDSWHIGISCRMGDQYGQDSTIEWGPGPVNGNPEIGNLKGPITDQTLVIKWFGCAGSPPGLPPG